MHRALVTLLLGLAATTADAEPMFRADQSHSGVYTPPACRCCTA